MCIGWVCGKDGEESRIGVVDESKSQLAIDGRANFNCLERPGSSTAGLFASRISTYQSCL